MAPFLHRHLFLVQKKGEDGSDLCNAEETFDARIPPYEYSLFRESFDQRYAQSPTAEPLSEDMVRLVRSQLATMFYGCIASSIPLMEKERFAWYVCSDHTYTRTFVKPRLHPKAFLPPSTNIRECLLEFADVHFAVYFNWSQALHTADASAVELLGPYITRKWSRLHDGRPPFLAYQKFAKAIGLRDREPRDIKKIREFHRSLCDAVSIGLNEQELPKRSPLPPRSIRIRSRPRNPNSPQPTNLRTYRDRGWEIAHLFRAIVMIFDNQSDESRDPEKVHYRVALSRKTGYGIVELKKERRASQFSVILAKTGDDAHLSSPISFQSLYDSGEALPVNRPDCDDDGTSLVRVKIDRALEFIFGLIQRERKAVQHVGLAADLEDRQHWEVCEKWVDGVMEHAGRVGIDENGFTWRAVRRAKASLNGEAFDEDQVDPLSDQLHRVHTPFLSKRTPEEPRNDPSVLPQDPVIPIVR